MESQDFILFKASNIVLAHAFDFKLFFKLKSKDRLFLGQMEKLFLG